MQSGWSAFEALNLSEFQAEMYETAGGMVDLLVDKRDSYGPHNLSKFGDVGVLIRASDKFERLVHMHREGMTTTAVGEDDEDAWRDIAGYALLVLLARRLGGEGES